MVSLELEARLDNLLSTGQKETANVSLFAPIPLKEECPICLIPLPLRETESVFMSCCGKNICQGCSYKQTSIDIKKGVPRNEQKCAFCCQIESTTNMIKSLRKLMKKNNADAFIVMAGEYESGQRTLQSDTRALEMRIRAAELGLAQAFSIIALNYIEGDIVERDTSKAFEFLEIAAKKGSWTAHAYLAKERKHENMMQRSIDHYKVAACAGHQASMDNLIILYKQKLLSKDELTQTLRACQASNNEMKSTDRDDARAFFEEHPMS